MKHVVPFLLAATLLAFPPMAHAASDADLRLALGRVRLYTETDLGRAFDAVAELKAQYPNNPQVLAAEAEVNTKAGNNDRALALLGRAHQLAPQNEDITEQWKSAQLLNAPFASLEAYGRFTEKQADEAVVRLSGEGRINPKLRAGAVLMNDDISVDPVLISSGATRSFSVDRQQLEAYGLYQRDNGDKLKGSVYLAEGVVGAGAQYQWNDRENSTVLEANVQRPDWDDFIVSIVDEGRRDNLRLTRTQRLMENLTGHAGVGLNHYGLKDNWNLAASYGIDAGLTYNFDTDLVSKVLGKESTFSLNYDLDAEYVIYNNHQHNTLNTNFRPLPLTHRQIHSFTAGASKDLFENFTVNGYAGVAADVYGTAAPLFGGAVTYQVSDMLTAEVRASRGILPEQSQQQVDEVGAMVKWKFF